jgi:hypothetical protein
VTCDGVVGMLRPERRSAPHLVESAFDTRGEKTGILLTNM